MRNYRSSIALALVVFTWLLGGIAEAREAGHSGGQHGGGEHLGVDRRDGHGPEGVGQHWDGHEGPRWRGEADHGWYGYQAPVYPYPDPYVPSTAVTPSAGYWYYCASANAYYTYVTQCPEGWQQVVP